MKSKDINDIRASQINQNQENTKIKLSEQNFV